ncbi:hypothetical protein BCR34DRAFT_584617 [Clohesyomyces aquaticus]|uniref:Uncharacterized protein n=1 Tax=Clohesyomyces aquaticus TaxID=1231657 RepID=A0A1Y2A0V3_9PLEO|nr:hypothetical protein BCR34DRAFT_584617 [Clohesyomyces aquaticus]
MTGNVALARNCCSGEDNDTPEYTTEGINDGGDQAPADNAAKIGYELEAGALEAVYDTEYCDGTDLKDSKPKDGKLEGIVYHAKSSSGEDQCTMKEWIDVVEAEQADPIIRVDKMIDGSVGKFGDHYEIVLDTNHEFGKAVKDVEDAIVGYHKKFANAPRKFRRRQDAKYSHIHRNAPRDDCAAPTATATESPTATAPPPTPSPTIGCELQHEYPDQGINQMGCICGSTTLPLYHGTFSTHPT